VAGVVRFRQARMTPPAEVDGQDLPVVELADVIQEDGQ
jgi:hypothetical protein